MLEEKLLADYKEALKARDALRSTLLSSLRAEIINAAIAKKKAGLDDAEVLAVIKKLVKQHEDSIDQFSKGNRQDLVDKEAAELKILKAYLPPELPLEEVKKIIEETVASSGACGLKDMGKVMKEVNAKIAGRSPGKLVNELVKERLSQAEKKSPPET